MTIKYEYQITPRTPELGGGWTLTLLENGEPVGGGVFPPEYEDAELGMAWFNQLTESQRRYWLNRADSARPADAWDRFLLEEAHVAAQEEGRAWLNSRRS